MITKVIPKLPFIEKQETLNFYIHQLGFTLLSDYGDYFLLNNGNTEIHFFLFPTLNPKTSDFMIYLRIDHDIETYYQDIQELNAKIHSNGKLEEKPWNQKEFSIVDPNGTLLTFGQSL